MIKRCIFFLTNCGSLKHLSSLTHANKQASKQKKMIFKILFIAMVVSIAKGGEEEETAGN